MTFSIQKPGRLSSHFPSIFADSIWDDFDKIFSSTKTFPESTSVPYDVVRFEDKTVLELAVAGFSKKDISIEVEDGYLTIRGEISKEEKNKGELLRKGISKRNFKYSFSLSEWVDENSVKADVKDGILHIDIPYKPEIKAKPNKKIIPIE